MSDAKDWREERQKYDEIPGMGYWKLDPHPAWLHLWSTTEGEILVLKNQVRQEVFKHQKPMTDIEREAVLAYMKAATVLESWKGSAYCRLCPTMQELGVTNFNDTPGHLGSRCMLTPDGKWKFPEKWEHYITEHGIRPTKEEFVVDAWRWFDHQRWLEHDDRVTLDYVKIRERWKDESRELLVMRDMDVLFDEIEALQKDREFLRDLSDADGEAEEKYLAEIANLRQQVLDLEKARRKAQEEENDR